MSCKPIKCEACEDKGYYLDRRCRTSECAHIGPFVTEIDDDGVKSKRRQKIMDCPKRPCTCPSGEPARAELRDRIAKQSDRLSVEVNWD